MTSSIKVIYPGRFQPFGPHHFQVYNWLCQRFGRENVFLSTSDVVEEDKSPLSFNEKKQVISNFGIEQVVCCKSPYKAEEILSQFDPNTSVIFVYGEKDAGRINYFKKDGSKGYFSKYLGQNQLESFQKTGYVLIAPHISLSTRGSQINSTLLRQILPSLTQGEFRGLMGWYDRGIHDLFKNKFGNEISEIKSKLGLSESVITKTQLERIEQYADRLFKEFGIDINFQNIYKGTHFYQRLNDPRNPTPISADELRNLFRKSANRYGNLLSKENDNAEGVLKDMSSDLNLPFIIKWDRQNSELDLVPKTIMKKKDFSTSSKIFAVEDFKNILSHGTYSKHLCHPYEDKTLTISKLKELVSDLFSGNVDHCSIKFDGHNFQVTYKNGDVLASRNKTTIVNPMTVDQVREKYQNKGDLEKTFGDAHEAIKNRILRFGNQPYLDSIFNNGRTFLNFEILHPLARNIYEYGDKPIISMHSLITYDEKGNEIHRSNNFSEFQGISGDWHIKRTPTITLKPNDKINDFYQRELNKFKETDTVHSNYSLKLLILAIGNILIKSIQSDQDQTNIAKIIELIIDSREIANKQGTRDKYDQALQDLKVLGGFNSINPIEGLVIQWQDRIYKLTGSFAALVPIFSIWNKNRYQS